MNQEVKKINGYNIKDETARNDIGNLNLSRIKTFDNVQSMKNDTTLLEGMHVKTKGYTSINDGLGAEYYITNTENESIKQELLQNGLYAEIIINSVTPLQFGAKGDGITDDSAAINKAFDYVKNSKGVVSLETNKTYKIDNPIYIPKGCSLYGNGATILSSIIDDYAIYVNSHSEDNYDVITGRDETILRHFTLEHTNDSFVENCNGIHFACHGIIEYVLFYKIDKCVRFCHGLYVDRFGVKHCAASTRTNSSNYAFDLGSIGDGHYIDTVQHTATGSNEEYQARFIYTGRFMLNCQVNNIIGNGLISINGCCDLSNIMLTFYGMIEIDTQYKVVNLNNIYASTDYIKNGRINIKQADTVNMNNCRFVNSYIENNFAIGNPVIYTECNHIYTKDCRIGCRLSNLNSIYALAEYSPILGNDFITNYKIYNINTIPVSPASVTPISTENGTLNGDYVYTFQYLYDKTRLIGIKNTRTSNSISLNNKACRFNNVYENAYLYITRTVDNTTKSAHLHNINKYLIDTGESINGIEWSDNLVDVNDFNQYRQCYFTGNNCIAFSDDNFTTPNGTWTKNDIIIAADGIYKYNGTTWINM